MKTRFCNQKMLPLIVEHDEVCGLDTHHESLINLCLRHGDFLRGKILAHGALLLRGFPLLSAPELAEFVRLFSGRETFDYTGGASPRIKLSEGVYTSTEYSSSIALSLHNELSYTYRWPTHLFFCCVVAPEEGGETTLGDSRALLKNIEGEIVRELKRRQVRYDRNLSNDPQSHYSWQAAFETHDKSSVESYCRRGKIDFRWKDDGSLWLSETRPATARHPITGDEVWFNQADGFHPSALSPQDYKALISNISEEDFRLNSYFGDGAQIPLAALEQIREELRRETVPVEWKAGDILILDNMLTAHGRLPFKGSRKILLAMS